MQQTLHKYAYGSSVMCATYPVSSSHFQHTDSLMAILVGGKDGGNLEEDFLRPQSAANMKLTGNLPILSTRVQVFL